MRKLMKPKKEILPNPYFFSDVVYSIIWYMVYLYMCTSMHVCIYAYV